MCDDGFERFDLPVSAFPLSAEFDLVEAITPDGQLRLWLRRVDETDSTADRNQRDRQQP